MSRVRERGAAPRDIGLATQVAHATPHEPTGLARAFIGDADRRDERSRRVK